MFRLAYFLKRKAGMSLDEFKERYETGHAALCRQSLARNAQEFSRKYLRPRRAGVDKDAKEPPDAAYDSVVELAFAAHADWDATVKSLSPADVAAIVADEATFADRSRRLACVVDEHLSPIGDVRRDHLLHWRAGSDLSPAQRAAAKARGMASGASLFKRKPGMPHEAFKDYYETRHVLIGYKYITYNAILYSRKFLRPLPVDPLAGRGSTARTDTPYDVFMELTFEVAEDRQQAVGALTSADIEQIAADEARFMDRGDRLAFTVDGPYQDAGKRPT